MHSRNVKFMLRDQLLRSEAPPWLSADAERPCERPAGPSAVPLWAVADLTS